MNGLGWVLLVGVTGWMTGKLIGEKGYGKMLMGYAINSLDIVLGIVGASIGSYLFFWAAVGEATSFSKTAISILGSVAFVWGARLVSTKFSHPSSRYNRYILDTRVKR